MTPSQLAAAALLLRSLPVFLELPTISRLGPPPSVADDHRLDLLNRSRPYGESLLSPPAADLIRESSRRCVVWRPPTSGCPLDRLPENRPPIQVLHAARTRFEQKRRSSCQFSDSYHVEMPVRQAIRATLNRPTLRMIMRLPPGSPPIALLRIGSLMTVRGLTALLFLLAPGVLSASGPDFDKEVLPILQSHCVRCHGNEKQESMIRLDNLSADLVNVPAAAENWNAVLNVLKSAEMPPEDEKQLSPQQLATLTEWIAAAIKEALDATRNTDGRVVLRRLNRVEYQNTMFDLLGLEMDYTRDLPPDGVSADGFTNDGSSLQMSAIQLEYYLDTARRALDRVIVVGEPPEVFDHQFTETKIDTWLGNAQRSNRLQRKQEFLAKMKDQYPEQGEFLLRVKLTAELKPNTGHPLLEVSVGYQPDTELLIREMELVEIKSADEQTLEFRGRLENFPMPVRGQGKYPGLVVRVRNRYDDGTPHPQEQKDENKKRFYAYEPDLPAINLKSVEFRGPIFETWPPAMHRNILFASAQRESDEPAYVAAVLRRFMSRAYRRPANDAEVARMADFFSTIRGEFPTFEETMRETLAMVLIQPEFLYHLEPAGDTKRTINDWELASRLSYFFWSTMPDQQLAELAEWSKLSDPQVLASEVDRLLDDDRSMAFIRQFTEQWLQLNHVDSVAIDRDYYPQFDDELKLHMRGETESFFAELIRDDLSAMNLLTSEFTMLNEPLAKHYGIASIFGREYRRVDFKPEANRGGLLGHASILLSNSTGSDSHVVRRAVWIRDRLLNDPPSPPPPDTPPLDEADPKFAKLSVREQLEVHRNREACANCHRGIDPWGIALENFDAVGLWRDQVRRKVGDKFETLAVKASDTLPNGDQLDGAASLKKHLSNERKNDFARSLVTRLLTYGLGRRLELTDQASVDAITSKFAENDYRLRGLLKNLVIDDLFRTK